MIFNNVQSRSNQNYYSTALGSDGAFVYFFEDQRIYAVAVGSNEKKVIAEAPSNRKCNSVYALQINSKNKILGICSKNSDPKSIEAKGTLIMIALVNDHELLAVGADGNLYRYALNEPNKEKQWNLFQAARDTRMPIERVAASPSGRICISQLGGKIFCLE